MHKIEFSAQIKHSANVIRLRLRLKLGLRLGLRLRLRLRIRLKLRLSRSLILKKTHFFLVSFFRNKFSLTEFHFTLISTILCVISDITWKK